VKYVDGLRTLPIFGNVGGHRTLSVGLCSMMCVAIKLLGLAYKLKNLRD
jgi:hypothetical protein